MLTIPCEAVEERLIPFSDVKVISPLLDWT